MSKKQSEETLVDVAEVYSKTETFVNDNGRRITTIFAVAIGILLAYFAYKKFVIEPKADEAANMIWKAEYYFGIDSLDRALEGDAFGNLGFLDIAADYAGTPTGNLASHYAGVCYLNKGEYDLALEYMSQASFDDVMLESARLGAIGDANAQLGDLDAAASSYSKAIDHSDNEFTAPMYLKKLGLIQEQTGDHASALKTFERIKKEYPDTNIGRSMDSYIARAAAKAQ